MMYDKAPLDADEQRHCCGLAPKTCRLLKFLIPGLIFAILAVTISFILQAVYLSGMHAKLVVTNADQSSYDDWVGYFGQGTPMYTDYYVFNLTNPYETLFHGAVPNYNELGPYVYKMSKTRAHVSFSNGGDQVSYSPRVTYKFMPEMSHGDAVNDVVYNMNPAYIGALGTAAGFYRTHIEFFASTLLDDVASQNAAAAISTKHAGLVRKYGDATFAEVWADETSSTGDWNGMLVAAVTGHASNIGKASVMKLFSGSEPLSLVSSTWTTTQMWGHLTTETTAKLATTFGITSAQVQDVAAWRSAFVTTFDLSASTLSSLNVTTAQEFGVLQWSTLKPTNGVSCTQLYPGMFAGPPEIGGLFHAFSIPQAPLNKFLFGLTHGVLVNPANWQQFLLYYQSQKFVAIEKIWGPSFTTTPCVMIFSYAAFTLNAYGKPFLQKVFDDHQSVIARRTVDGWLFDAKDPLLGLLWPAASHNGHFFTNNSATNDAVFPSTLFNYTQYTGMNDITKLNWIHELNGEPDVPQSFWNGTEPVAGTDATQFQFNIKRNQTLHIWENDLSRRLDLVPPSTRVLSAVPTLNGTAPVNETTISDTMEFLGLQLYNYVVDPDSALPDRHYFQMDPGFWNISGSRNNAPIFVSNPHFYGCHPTWRERLQGVSVGNAADHLTIVSVFPGSGTTLTAHKRSQVNLYMSKADKKKWFPHSAGTPCKLPVCFANIASGYMFPLVWFDEHAAAGEDKVFLIKLIPKLKVGLTIAFGVLALLILVTGILATTVWWKNEKICGIRVRPATSEGRRLGDVSAKYSPLAGEAEA